MKKIDIHNHVLPPAYFELVKARSKDTGLVKRRAGLRMLWDLEARAIDTLGARVVQILSSVNGRPLDDPEFFPVFRRMATHRKLPIWMHPVRPGTRSDYPAEERSRYGIWQGMGLGDEAQEKLYLGNALRLMRLPEVGKP